MKPQSPAGGNPTLASLSSKLLSAFEQQLQSLQPRSEDLNQLITAFHKLDAAEEDKLRQKDKDLVNMIASFLRTVGQLYREDQISEAEAALFVSVAGIFSQVESILWELKKLPGDPPQADPIPEPFPDPGPGGSREF